MGDQSVCCPWCGQRFQVPEFSTTVTLVCSQCEFEFEHNGSNVSAGRTEAHTGPGIVANGQADQEHAGSENGSGLATRILLVSLVVPSLLAILVVAGLFVLPNGGAFTGLFEPAAYAIRFPEDRDTVYSFHLNSEFMKAGRDVSGTTRFRRFRKGEVPKSLLDVSLKDESDFKAVNRLTYHCTMIDLEKKYFPEGAIELGEDLQPTGFDWEFDNGETIPFLWLPVGWVGIEPTECLNQATWVTEQQGTVEFQRLVEFAEELNRRSLATSQSDRLNERNLSGMSSSAFLDEAYEQFQRHHRRSAIGTGNDSSRAALRNDVNAIQERMKKMMQKMEERRRAVRESTRPFRSKDEILERIQSRNRDDGISFPSGVGVDPQIRKVIEDAKRRSRIGIEDLVAETSTQVPTRTRSQMKTITRFVPIRRRVSYRIESESESEIRVSKTVQIEPENDGQDAKLVAELTGYFVFDKRKKLVVESFLNGTAEYETDQMVVEIPVEFSCHLEQ